MQPSIQDMLTSATEVPNFSKMYDFQNLLRLRSPLMGNVKQELILVYDHTTGCPRMISIQECKFSLFF